MKLHIVTAVSRLADLDRIADSIFSQPNPDDVEIHWHLGHEEGEVVGGQAIKNRLLDDIYDGWIYILDDDTVMHPQFLQVVPGYALRPTEAILFAQVRNAEVWMPQLQAGVIDIGQAVLRRDLIADHRIPESYDGDGFFLSKVCAGASVTYLSEPLSFYNLLRKE